MISLSEFVYKVFCYVNTIFESFHKEEYVKMFRNIEALKKHVELEFNNVSDPGSTCDDYIPYRTVNAAMRKETLEIILKVANDFIKDSRNADKKRLLSQNLWMLVDGWNEESVIRLVMARLSMESTVTYRHKNK